MRSKLNSAVVVAVLKTEKVNDCRGGAEPEEEEVAAKQELSTDKDAAKQFLVEMV